jgi:hypothetical protein
VTLATFPGSFNIGTREPGKGERFDVLRFKAQHLRAQNRSREFAGQAPHQARIACTAAADKHGRPLWRVTKDGVGDGARRQLDQCRRNIGWRRFMPTHALLQPAQVKQVPASALGRRLDEKRLIQKQGQQGSIDLALGRPGPITIKRLLQMLLGPGIKQHVARSAVEAKQRQVAAVGRQDRHVADAADVHHHPRAVGRE